ncbi:DUF3168 domain-containing protein [Shinella zoogloeoides]|uniref:tail completion protein gp17 n=1 Tax=Shinella zoogloeoides TaxID=352475 RepID=UPI00299E6E9E|nr:DUF3168 domain-containing protein [Shinella zoogloeoides]WPE19959.1 hypothetical protein ShzoTeo12_11390 [Shinella zoogloeoides]
MSSIIIVNRLLSRHPGVSGLVQNRIYPIQAPQMVDGPYIVTNETSIKDHPTTEGAGGYYKDRVTIETIAPSGDLALEIAQQAMVCLDAVLDLKVDRYRDVTCLFAGVGMTDSNDRNNEARRILRQYFVWWRLP